MTPRLGLQGPVMGWADPWAPAATEAIMRTGTGRLVPSQDETPSPADFLGLLREFGADFYVHHVTPDLTGQPAMMTDLRAAGIDVCLGNEYGNINGPYVTGTNRYDLPAEATPGVIGLLYDEPEHLQINAGQYRKDEFRPHFGGTDGMTPQQAEKTVEEAVRRRIEQVGGVPVISEHVFPVLFHTFARAGMTLCPKVMKECFQPLQLATALGAARQYHRDLWICADLWGPDVGDWFTRAPGFPGHSPAEYESALKLAYYFGPTHLFTENIDVLARYGDGRFTATEFGDVWQRFVHEFVPTHPIHWRHSDARPGIVVVHAEDSNYGRDVRPFGNRENDAPEASRSVFAVWHLLSHGTIPAHGSCMHIPGYEFPRHRLSQLPRESFPLTHGVSNGPEPMHPLFYPVNNALVFDQTAGEDELGDAGLIIVAGSRIDDGTRAAIRRRAEAGATVVIARWLVDAGLARSGRCGAGQWHVTDDFLSPAVAEICDPYLGSSTVWTQRMNDTEIRVFPADEGGFTLDFEIAGRP